MGNRARTILLRFKDKEGSYWVGAAFLADLKREDGDESITLQKEIGEARGLRFVSLNVIEEADRILVFGANADEELLREYTEWINANAAHQEGIHIDSAFAVADFIRERGRE